MNYSEKIGLYYGEPQLGELMEYLHICGTPRCRRGDDTAYLANHCLGVELTFEEEASLAKARRRYADGALVLSNIRFYGSKIGSFSAFSRDLPRGVKFGTKRTELVAMLGEPDWSDPNGRKLSWEGDFVWFQTDLNDQGEVEIVSLQHSM